MRIVFVAWHGSIHTRRWVAFFARRGHEVHVITCGDGDAPKEEGARYHVHDLGTPILGKLGYFFKISATRRLIRRLKPDIVHAHFVTSYGLLALRSGFQPLVVTAHGDDVLIAPNSRVLRPIVQRVLRAAQLVTVPSDVMREAVLELAAPTEPSVAVFQYGVEVERLAKIGEAERARASDSGALRIVSARALLELYRIDELLRALAIVRDRGVEFHCDVLGDGPQRAQLESLATELDIIDLVTFHGHARPEEVERAIGGADLYVSVSDSDGVSLALLEALALGAVPVLSDIPANRDWITDGQTGVLVDITPEAIADGIGKAARLNRMNVAMSNLATVYERADREKNLTACEILIDALQGVTFEPADESAA